MRRGKAGMFCSVDCSGVLGRRASGIGRKARASTFSTCLSTRLGELVTLRTPFSNVMTRCHNDGPVCVSRTSGTRTGTGRSAFFNIVSG